MSNQILSAGALTHILNTKDTSTQPIVQVMLLKMMNNNKYRAVLYDGKDVQQHCILISQHFEEMQNQLERYTVVKLTNYVVTNLKNNAQNTVLVVNDLQILKSGELNRINLVTFLDDVTNFNFNF